MVVTFLQMSYHGTLKSKLAGLASQDSVMQDMLIQVHVGMQFFLTFVQPTHPQPVNGERRTNRTELPGFCLKKYLQLIKSCPRRVRELEYQCES